MGYLSGGWEEGVGGGEGEVGWFKDVVFEIGVMEFDWDGK